MLYPTLNEVKNASHEQLATWQRFLAEPGARYLGDKDYNEILERETAIWQKITTRLDKMGGITNEISNKIGNW